eukprot:10925200-Prorocentrum_lima.AAC.1
MTSSLVGSEMCIRDRVLTISQALALAPALALELVLVLWLVPVLVLEPVSYTHLTLPTICSV